MSNPQSRDPDALRQRAGIEGDPGQDQHFLVDDRVLDRLPTYLPEEAHDHVLEIGAGTGALTDRLLTSIPDDSQVTAVERDTRLADFLREEFQESIAAERLEVLAGDALEVDLPPFTGSVSNLPYGVSSEIAFRLLPAGVPLVLMFQAEFADRLAAEPGDSAYGRLSVTSGHYASVEIVERVPKEAFDPQPAVASAVVRATPRSPDYEIPSHDTFASVVRASFTQRRKTMRNAIRNTTHMTGLDDTAVAAVVEAAGDQLMSKRAGSVTPAEFASLARLVAKESAEDGDG
ncbi:MAG: dimethyladenosine transferase [uncultured archaeon A07HR60]|nr:MAG: dimethyladenosine transferase [uncultured archaeon A07HR60]